MPEPRWFHWAGLGNDGRIYAFGGYVLPRGEVVRQHGLKQYAMVVYDPQQDMWQRGPEPPAFRTTLRDVNRRRTLEGEWFLDPWETTVETKVDHQRMTGASGGGGEIYWFARRGDGPVIFDPETRAWTQPEGVIYYRNENRYEGSVPLAYAHNNAATATGPDGKIYLLGGFSRPKKDSGIWERTLLRQVEVYDPKTNAWSEIAPMQRARQLFAACFGPDGKLYVFGGYGHEGSITQRPGESDAEFARRGAEMRALDEALDFVEAWDPKTDSWSLRAPMPLGVIGAGAALGADGRIYVVGGTPLFSSSSEPIDRVQVYDPRTDSWSNGPSLNVARHGHAVVATPDGKIYAIGGTNRHSVFHPRQMVGGRPGKKGELLDSVEVLETEPREPTAEPRPAPPDWG